MKNFDQNGTAASFFRAFSEHPASVDETYFEHLCFAAKLGGRLLLAGGAAFTHALIPPLFETTASRQVAAIHELMESRHHSE